MSSAENLIEDMRRRCQEKGLNGIKGLATLFRRLDIDFSQNVTFEEFMEGMQKYGMGLSPRELWLVFTHMDRDQSGKVDFAEFLHKLRPPMSQLRVDVVNEAFDKLDVIRDDKLKVEDLKIAYRENAESHPNFRSGEWTLEETLRHFLDAFDDPDDRDGVVTRAEFLSYYSAVSATVDDDAYFDMTMRASWGLPPKKVNSS